MDCTQFAKLCREAGLLGGALTATAADLAFVSKAQQRVRGSLREPGCPSGRRLLTRHAAPCSPHRMRGCAPSWCDPGP
jgi:hypothetical protein